MAFDGEARPVERRTHANVCRGAIAFLVDDCFGSVNPAGGEQFLPGCEIERWKNEAPAGACSCANFSDEREGAAEKVRGAFHMTKGNCGADGGTRNGGSANLQIWHALDLEIVRAAKRREQTRIAGLAMAKAEIFADQNSLGVQYVRQNALDKLLRSHGSHGGIELQNVDRI